MQEDKQGMIIQKMLQEAGAKTTLEYIRNKIRESGCRLLEEDDETMVDIIFSVMQTVCEAQRDDAAIDRISEMVDFISSPRRYYTADAIFALNTYLNYGYTAEDAKKIVKDIQKTVIGFIEEAERREKEPGNE